MGTLRWERELQERNEEARRKVELEQKRREIELSLVEANARMEVLKREAEARTVELDILSQQEQARDEADVAGQVEHMRRRRADEVEP